MSRAKELLPSLPLTNTTDDVDIAWRNWVEEFVIIMEKCIPKKLVPTQSETPWINGEIRNDIARWERVYNRFKRSKSQDILQRYKSLRNSIVSKIRLAKKTFLNNLSSSLNDAKKFWSTIRKIHPRPDPSSMILTHGSVSASSNSDKAALLNHFFSSCFNDSTTTLTFSTPSAEDVCRDMDWADCTPEGISALLKQIKPHSSAGPDGITAWMLRSFADEIAPSITSLFNLSIKTGNVPADWKLSNVVPIPKGDKKKNEVQSYRPISLLLIISKVLERHFHQLISEFISKNNILANDQFGFWPGRCTTTPLLLSIHEWHKALESRKTQVQ